MRVELVITRDLITATWANSSTRALLFPQFSQAFPSATAVGVRQTKKNRSQDRRIYEHECINGGTDTTAKPS